MDDWCADECCILKFADIWNRLQSYVLRTLAHLCLNIERMDGEKVHVHDLRAFALIAITNSNEKAPAGLDLDSTRAIY